MLKRIAGIAMCAIIAAFLLSCNAGDGRTATPAALPEAGFIWQPGDTSPYGADTSNREAFGMADARDDIIYYQAYPSEAYLLCSYDMKTGETKELAANCYGMINASDDAVYYIGSSEKGIFRYAYEGGAAEKLYAGNVSNLVSTKEWLFFIEGEKLCRIGKDGAGYAEIMGGINAYSYLDVVEDAVYFAREVEPYVAALYCVKENEPGAVTVVKERMPAPVKHLGSHIVCRDLNGTVYLLDAESGGQTILLEDSEYSHIAANGNAVFLTQADREGNAELCVYDLEGGRALQPIPIRCTAVYFMGEGVYLADVAGGFSLERVLFDPEKACTEPVIENFRRAR